MATLSLPPDVDFKLDKSASPDRMNRAMLYLVTQIVGLQAARQTFDGMLTQLESIGITRINDVLAPVFRELDSQIAQFQSVFESQAIDCGTYAAPGTRIGLRRSNVAGEVPGSLSPGELGVNEADGILHWLDATGAVRGTPLVDLATNAAVSKAIAAVLAQIEGGAPGALDTLKELADALADDPNFSATITSALNNRLRIDALQGLTVPQQTLGRNNLLAAKSGANTDITSAALTTLTCSGAAAFGTRPTFNGSVPYDAINLTSAQIAAILGYTPGRQGLAVGVNGADVGNLAVSPSYQTLAQTSFVAIGNNSYFSGICSFNINNQSGQENCYIWLVLFDNTAGAVAVTHQSQLITASSADWRTGVCHGAASNLTIGHNYTVALRAAQSGAANNVPGSRPTIMGMNF